MKLFSNGSPLIRDPLCGANESSAIPNKRTSSQIRQSIQFSQRLNDVPGWVRKADELLAAASFLEGEIRDQWAAVRVEDGRIVGSSGRTSIEGPYFVLVAYALENLFKACLVHRNTASLQNRTLARLPPFLNEHDLIKLARALKFAVDISDEDLLTRLSRNSIWAGRYPIPTNPSADRAIQVFSSGAVHLTAFFHPSDVDRLLDLVSRVRQFVRSETEKCAV